jgi:hypothetical protein
MPQSKKQPNRLLILAAVVVVIAAVALIVTKTSNRSPFEGYAFDEPSKEGGAALIILGDYFSEAFAKELAAVVQSLSPVAEKYFICTDRIKTGLVSWMQKMGIERTHFFTTDRTAPIMKVWARDIAVCGRKGKATVIAVPPNMYARREADAKAMLSAVRSTIGQGARIVRMPFAMDGGNAIFIERRGRKILLLGKKTIFDNLIYARNSWVKARTEDELLADIGRFFDADSVVVVGRIQEPPPAELYFEYHLDLAMAVLRNDKAVVAQFPFGDEEKAELEKAVAGGDPIVESLFEPGRERDEILDLMSERLSFVSEEYDYYATLLEDLGLEVFRSPTDWKHVAGWMSWTTVVQAGPRLFMPVYPSSINTAAEIVRGPQGEIRKKINFKDLPNEQFQMEGFNLENFQLYKRLGYEVIPIPDYLHYFEGGLHRFVTIIN